MLKTVWDRALIVGCLLGLSGGAFAADPVTTTGLGQSWPNASDVSADPHYHAYVFMMNGIKFVQINDAAGNVLGAVGASGGQFLTLPMGRYWQFVSTPQQPAAAPLASATQTSSTVYHDNDTQVVATPASDGTVHLQAQALSSADCTDPVVCNSHIDQAQ